MPATVLSAPTTPPPALPANNRVFLLVHALLVPVLLAAAALWSQTGGLDDRVSAWFFDPLQGGFLGHDWPALEVVGHRLAKSCIWGLWVLVLVAALAAPWVPRLSRHRATLWATAAALALGPSLVVVLKGLNAHHCPWDLKIYGGTADFAGGWFVSAAEAGRCFPSGHAAGGFALIALCFAGRASHNRSLEHWGLAAALVVGSVFSAVRIAQGAHFLSHNLWAAAIDWWVAALVFAPLLGRRRQKSPSP